MAWWQWLRSGSPSSEARGAFPVSLPVVPGELTVRVHVHTIDSRQGPLPCWSYVTDGLAVYGQKELVFTLQRQRREAAADFPRQLLEFFRGVHQAAVQGRHVVAGNWSQFLCPSGFLGQHDAVTVVYDPAQHLEGVDLPADALAVILLAEEEAEVVQQLGPYRVLTLLGQTYRYYPCPPWAERHRPGVLSRQAAQESLLMKIPCLPGAAATVRWQIDRAANPRIRLPTGDWLAESAKTSGERLTLRIESGSLTYLQETLGKLPAGAPFALLTRPDPRADARLVWKPGQERTESIIPPGSEASCYTGGFVAFLSAAEQADSEQVLEDGFALCLSEASGTKVREALQRGQSLAFPVAGDGLSFSLEWIALAYTNPVENVTYNAEGGWHAALSDAPRPEPEERPVRWRGSIFLTPGAAVKSSEQLGVDEDTFFAYIGALDRVVQEHFGALPSGPGLDLFLQCEIYPGRVVHFRWAFRPANVGGETVRGRELHGRLEALRVPQVRKEPIKYQMIFTIWGGSGEPMPFPELE
jgi:hypothetical protein